VRSAGFPVTVPRSWKSFPLSKGTRQKVKAALGKELKSDPGLAKPLSEDITSSAGKDPKLLVIGPTAGAGNFHQHITVLVLPTCAPGVSIGCTPGADRPALGRVRNDTASSSSGALHVKAGPIGTLNGQPCFTVVISFPSPAKGLGGIHETEYYFPDYGKVYGITISGASPSLAAQIAASFKVAHPAR
jgi:hypothetical protein